MSSYLIRSQCLLGLLRCLDAAADPEQPLSLRDVVLLAAAFDWSHLDHV